MTFTAPFRKHHPNGTRYSRRFLAVGVLTMGAAVGGFLIRVRQGHLNETFWENLMLAAMIVGAMLTTLGLLLRRIRTLDEAYHLGYDIGYERGAADAAAGLKPDAPDTQG